MCIFEAAQGFALHAGTFRRSGQPCYSPARQQRRNLPPLFSVFFFLNRDYLDKVSTVCCFFCRLSNSQFFFFPPSLKGFQRFVTAVSGSLVYFRNYVGSTPFFFFYTRYYYYDVLCSCFCLNEREKKTLYLLSFAFFIHVTTKIGNATFCFFGALLLLRTLLRPLLLVNQQFFFFSPFT